MTLTEKFRKFLQDKQEQARIRNEWVRKDHEIQAIRLGIRDRQIQERRMKVSK